MKPNASGQKQKEQAHPGEITDEVRAQWRRQDEIRRQGRERLLAYISEGLRKMETHEAEEVEAKKPDETVPSNSVRKKEPKAKRSQKKMNILQQDARQCDARTEVDKKVQRTRQEHQMDGEKGESQNKVKVKQRAKKQREETIQQQQQKEQLMAHNLEALKEIIQNVSETDREAHEMVR